MLITPVIVTCIIALVHVFQTLPISATLARILTPTVSSAPSRTQRIPGPTPFSILVPVPLPPTGGRHWARPKGFVNESYSFQRETLHSPWKPLETLTSVTIHGVPGTPGQRLLFWISGGLIAASILASCSAFSGSASPSKSVTVDGEQLVILPSNPEVRPLPQQVVTTPRKSTPGAGKRSPRDCGSLCEPHNSSDCHITPPSLHVTPFAMTNAPSWDCDHTSRRVFGVPVPAQASQRGLGGLDDLDDGSYLRDALGLIDWSDIPPHCGYWPTLDEDAASEGDGDDLARPCGAWYASDDDLRGWVFPVGSSRPDRSEPAELLVAGEG